NDNIRAYKMSGPQICIQKCNNTAYNGAATSCDKNAKIPDTPFVEAQIDCDSSNRIDWDSSMYAFKTKSTANVTKKSIHKIGLIVFSLERTIEYLLENGFIAIN